MLQHLQMDGSSYVWTLQGRLTSLNPLE
ncbi:uncharacterized protein METZ01_LOCUS95155 [marine metagenome]|uniref:Uncharacterized protein n=1 Tax=marine metagenome TaxID=408172 RepID=A0A381VQI4_9ZZZZ